MPHTMDNILIIFIILYGYCGTHGISYKNAFVVRIAPLPDVNHVDTILYLRDKYEQPDNPKIELVSELLTHRLNLTFILPVDCRQEVLTYLEDNNILYDIPITDLQTTLRHHTDENIAARDGNEDYTHTSPAYYMGYHEMVSWIHSVVEDHRDVASVSKLGQTYENRDILAIKIQNDESTDTEVIDVFINAGLDPRNWLAPASALYLIHQILSDSVLRDGVKWTIVPLANPDGYMFNMETNRLWMKNRQPYGECIGTDLVKNWPQYHGLQAARSEPCHRLHRGPEPFSEAETRALRDAILADTDLDAYVSIQGTPGAWMLPWSGKSFLKTEDYEDLLDVAVAVTGAINTDDDIKMLNGTPPDLGRPASGAPMDWVKQHTSIKYAYTMALVHAGDDSPLPFVQPPSQISQNGQWLTTAMSAMTSSIRNFLDTGEWEHVTWGGKPKGYQPPRVRYYELNKDNIQQKRSTSEL